MITQNEINNARARVAQSVDTYDRNIEDINDFLLEVINTHAPGEEEENYMDAPVIETNNITQFMIQLRANTLNLAVRPIL